MTRSQGRRFLFRVTSKWYHWSALLPSGWGIVFETSHDHGYSAHTTDKPRLILSSPGLDLERKHMVTFILYSPPRIHSFPRHQKSSSSLYLLIRSFFIVHTVLDNGRSPPFILFSTRLAPVCNLKLGVVPERFVNMYLLCLSILASFALANDPTTISDPQVLKVRRNEAFDPPEITVVGSTCPSGETACPGTWEGGIICINKPRGDVCCPQGCKFLLSKASRAFTYSSP